MNDMCFTCKERNIVLPFYKYLSDNKFSEEPFFLKWKNGTSISVVLVTTDDDDNGLDLDDPNYEDYTSFIVRIIKLINYNDMDGFKKEWLKEGVLFEFNYKDFPNEIYNSRGELISKR